MPSPIISHERAPHSDDDPTHPIPWMRVLDVVGIRKGGGADLSIIIASPLAADVRSLTRLLDKIEGYLKHLRSPEFESEAGIATPDNTSIVVRIHPQSASEAFELLARSGDWVRSHNASLKIEPLDSARH
jgi:hypothetical protein